MFKKYLSACVFALIGLFSVQANAVLVTQNISLDVTLADTGNAFGLDVGTYNDIGFISFDSDDTNTLGFGFVDETTLGFDLSLTFGAYTFTAAEDIDPGFPLAILIDDLDPLLGVDFMDAVFEDASSNAVDIFANAVSAFGFDGLGFVGNLTFGDASVVPAPATLALFGLGLVMLGATRRQQAA